MDLENPEYQQIAENPEYQQIFENPEDYQSYDTSNYQQEYETAGEEEFAGEFETAPPETDCTCDPCDCDCDDPKKKKKSSLKPGELFGEDGCTCDPCECETPPGSAGKVVVEVEEEEEAAEAEEESNPFLLDEFARAKAFFMKTSTKSGISLYDHLSEVIRKLLDHRSPKRPVDYFEEISMNVKRYRFQQQKDVLQDVFYISEPVLNDARLLTNNWKLYAQWSEAGKKDPGEGFVAGNFSNLLRLQYYLEQVNIGLPREEMFRLALAIKDLTATKSHITKARFWGKVFGMRKNYYVIEADLNGSGEADLWKPSDESQQETGGAGENANSEVPGAQETFVKAGNVVLDKDVLSAYSKTSGLPPDQQINLLPKPKSGEAEVQQNQEEWGGEGHAMPPHSVMQDAEAAADYAKWQGYQEELMTKFPTPPPPVQEVDIPPEADGSGVNRRAFYVCNDIGQPWILLPPITPKQVSISRQVRWGLTGDLNSDIRSYPSFPGKEGHFLKTMLARASAGSLVSPKGFYRGNAYPSEFEGEDDEDIDEEEESSNPLGDDRVVAVKKYRPSMDALTNAQLNFWVHHACPILPQGRNVWWNPIRAKKNPGDETEEESEDEGEEYEGEDRDMPTREVGPPLFTPISKDTSPDGRAPWTLVTSTTVFKEFQVASVRSNIWPGSSVICTVKGKVDNIYLGDCQKFSDRSYVPFMHDNIMREYKSGPEMEEFPDPTVDEEQNYLNKLQLAQLADVEPPFEDNEEMDGEGEYSDED